jgi:hypothetical protein
MPAPVEKDMRKLLLLLTLVGCAPVIVPARPRLRVYGPPRVYVPRPVVVVPAPVVRVW